MRNATRAWRACNAAWQGEKQHTWRVGDEGWVGLACPGHAQHGLVAGQRRLQGWVAEAAGGQHSSKAPRSTSASCIAALTHHEPNVCVAQAVASKGQGGVVCKGSVHVESIGTRVCADQQHLQQTNA